MRAVYYTQDMLVFKNQKGSAEGLSPGRAYDQHLALLPSAVRLGEEPHMSIERALGAINWEAFLDDDALRTPRAPWAGTFGGFCVEPLAIL